MSRASERAQKRFVFISVEESLGRDLLHEVGRGKA